MTDYSNGKNVLLRRPEPGRPIHHVVSQKKEEGQNVSVDTNAIADAVIKAIVQKMPSNRGIVTQITDKTSDDFNTSESLQKLADAMIINENKDSKLDGIGNIKEVKKDNIEVDKTIDLLSQNDD